MTGRRACADSTRSLFDLDTRCSLVDVFLILPLISLPGGLEFPLFGSLDTEISDKLHDFLLLDFSDQGLSLKEILNVFIQIVNSPVEILLSRLLSLKFLLRNALVVGIRYAHMTYLLICLQLSSIVDQGVVPTRQVGVSGRFHRCLQQFSRVHLGKLGNLVLGQESTQISDLNA